MKKLSILLSTLFVLIAIFTQAQSVGVGTTTPHASAVLDVSSTNKGLLLPRVSLANRPASPAAGLVIYQTDNTPGIYYYNGSTWLFLSTGGVTGSGVANNLTMWNGSNTITNNSSLVWDAVANRLSVSSNNNGTGFTNWIAANFGGTGGNRVVTGVLNGEATIGAHNSTLSGWATLNLNPAGAVRVPSIAGGSTQMVTVATDGTLSSQAIAAGNAGTVTNVSATAPLSITNGTTTPAISLAQANGSTNGFLSSTDWNTFNNKQNTLGNASTTASGILTSTDWNTFNNKGTFTLPNLTSGSILFSNGTTIAQNNNNFFWNNTTGQLGLGTNSPNRTLTVNSTNTGTGVADWIAGNFGGTAGNRVVAGILNGEATIAAHTNALDNWAKLVINPVGTTAIGALTGTGTRMVVANASGEVSTQAIPTGGDNLGNHTATVSINLAANKLVGNGGTAGISIANNVSVTTDGALTTLGATTVGTTLNVAGATTLSNLAGTGNRMVVANATGLLTTQAIPTADNLGNHTATQNLNLGNNWLSNGTSANNGLRISTSGNVGIRLDNPVGTLDVPTFNTTYTGTFAEVQAQAVNYFASSTTPYYPNCSPAGGFTQSSSDYRWAPSVGTSTQTMFLGCDFGAGNAKTIRQIYLYAEKNQALTNGIYLRINFNLEGSNNGTNYTTVFNSGFLVNSINGGALNYNSPAFNNTNAYRYYRLRFLNYEISVDYFSWTTGSSDLKIQDTRLSEESSTSAYNSGAFTVLPNGNIGVGTNAPTANLDVVGGLRLRSGALTNAVLTSDANGNATWAATAATASNLSATASIALNNNWLSNNATATGIRIDNSGNMGVGVVANTFNRLTVAGTGGVRANTTNNGTGSTDWIGINAGGTSGERFVGGSINGVATIGGHNLSLNAWTPLVINPGGGGASAVTIGSNANVSPIPITGGSPFSLVTPGALDRKLMVNGSIRQGYYTTPVNIPANNIAVYNWNHNLGYGPIVMMSTDQNGGGGYMDFVNVTTYNTSADQTVFVLRNLGGNAATGNLRWILVW